MQAENGEWAAILRRCGGAGVNVPLPRVLPSLSGSLHWLGTLTNFVSTKSQSSEKGASHEQVGNNLEVSRSGFRLSVVDVHGLHGQWLRRQRRRWRRRRW